MGKGGRYFQSRSREAARVINLFAGKALDSSHPQEFAFFLQDHNKENPHYSLADLWIFSPRIFLFFLHWIHSIGASHRQDQRLKLNCVAASCNLNLTSQYFGFAARASFRRFSCLKEQWKQIGCNPVWVSGNFKGNTKQAVGRGHFGKGSI